VAIPVLTSLIAILAVIAAGTGLLSRGGEGVRTVTSVRGAEVELYGRGIYRNDTVFAGAGNRGTDAVVLLLGVPLLVLATVLHRRESLRGSLLLLGVLGFFLYVYVSYSTGIAFNRLFLVYVTLASASLFAFVLCYRGLDPAELRARLSPAAPRRALGWFMIVSGAVTAAIWLPPLAGTLIENEVPARLGSYTTSITDAIDLGVITPSALLAGWLLLRGDERGYVVAMSLLVLEVLLAPLIVAQTLFQLDAEVEFTAAELAGPVAGFVTISLAALWAVTGILRHVEALGGGRD